MQLDREDDVLPGSTQAFRALDKQALTAPDAWFVDKAPAVAVVVKRKRLLGLPPPADATAPSADDTAAGDERRPRVFVLPKETASNDAAQAAPTPAQPADAATPTPLRRRRRRLPEHRPSPVVHIVMPPSEDAAPAADEGFVLDLPGLDEWRELQAALAGVRRLVDDAESASRWALKPVRRRAG